MQRYYAGIGTRTILPRAKIYERDQLLIGKLSAMNGVDLKSGGASFSDFNHLAGAKLGGRGNSAIVVRSENFKDYKRPLGTSPITLLTQEEDYEKALEYFFRNGIFEEKNFRSMKQFTRDAHARNFYQIMDIEGKSANVEYVSYLSREDRWGNVSGGTRSAVAVARLEGVPCYNTIFKDQLEELLKVIKAG